MPIPEWNIRPESMSKYLEQLRTGHFTDDDLVSKTEFTILRNARRNTEDIAELAAAIGANDKVIGNMVSLPTQRLVLFETIAAIETSIRLSDNTLKPITVDLYRHHMKKGVKALQVEIDKQVQEKTLITLNEMMDFNSKGLKEQGINTLLTLRTELVNKPYFLTPASRSDSPV